jgi:predicted MFS family arabinose efflux permease
MPAVAVASDRSSMVVAVAGLIALAVAMGIGRFAFTPILPMMQDDAGVSVATGGWLASANYVGYLVGAVSAMVLRLPAVTAIRAGLIVIGVATLAMGIEHRLAGWVLLRGLAGVASAWVLIFVSAWSLEKLSPLQRPLLAGAVFSGVGTGIALAGGFALVVMYTNGGSAQAWGGLGGVSLVLTALIWRNFGMDGERASGPAERSTAAAHRWDAESVRLVLCYGAFGFGYIIPATFLPVMARQAMADPSIFGWTWPVFGAAAALSTLAAAVWPTLAGNRRLWSLSHLVMAVGVALPVFRAGIVEIMLAALFVGGTFVVITMAGMREARDVAGPRATGLMAAMTSAFALGQIAGPVCVSLMVDAGRGLQEALLFASVLLVVSAFVLARRKR